MADASGAVRRTPRPAWGEDRQAAGTAAQPGRGATNPGHPVSPDTGNCSGDLRAKLIEQVTRELGDRMDLCAYVDVDVVDDRLSDVIAAMVHVVLTAGWIPGDVVREFCADRAEYITAINNCAAGNDRDYWRWNGHAEARRQLSERLGLPTAWPTEVPT